VLIVVGLACLAAPAAASAHSRTPAVALDVRLRLDAAPAGLRASVIDGDRALRLAVAAGTTVVVKGLLGEPVLRFDDGGVWANASSPTAAADKLVPRRASGWIRRTRDHAFVWHDHRLAPPRSLRTTAPWALPLTIDGRAARLSGTFERVPRPALWPWLLGALGVFALVALAGRRLPRPELAASLAGVAAAAALAATTAFATGDAIARRAQWLEVASAVALALVAAASLVVGDRRLRIWAAMVVGIVAASLGLGSLGVFFHGVVISSLPAVVARLATGLAVVGGAAAAVLAVLTPTPGGRR
jgi:hypothetical protein